MPDRSARPGARRPTPVVVFAIAGAVVVGMLVAVQSRINGELGVRVGDGFIAALISFVVGLVALSVALAFWRPGRQGLSLVVRAVRARDIPWWYLVGGGLGAFFVVTQTLTAVLLGVALFTVATVSGQTLSGLLIDRRGLGTMAAKPLTVVRVVGSALAVVAVIVAVSAQLRGDVAWWVLVLPFVAGLGAGWQQAVNGQVSATAQSALTATFLNFVIGTVVLVVASIVSTSLGGWPESFPTEPWVYVGGMIGVLFVAATSVIVRVVGVLLVGLATVAGQLVMSVVLDVVFPTAGHVIAASTVVGTALTLVAVAIAAIPGGRTIGSSRTNSVRPPG